MTIRLALADDHPLVLDGLAHRLGREPDLEVVALCPDGEAALRAVAERRPDVLVLDLRMPRLGGLEVLRRLAQQKSATRVVVLAGEVGEAELLEAVRLGARGVALKGGAPGQLVACVRAVHAGERWLESGLAGLALEHLLAREAARQEPADPLTPRERELVGLVGQGLRNKEIAARLRLAEGTVKMHLVRVFGKLGVTNRVELANRVRREGG